MTRPNPFALDRSDPEDVIAVRQSQIAFFLRCLYGQRSSLPPEQASEMAEQEAQAWGTLQRSRLND